MIEIAAAKISKCTEEEFNSLMSCISPKKRKKILMFRNYEDSLRSLFADILARYMLCGRLKISNQQLIFDNNPYGKPFVLNRKVHYNISHSGNWVVCAVSDLPIGIDTEEPGPIDLKIAESFFSSSENDMILHAKDEEKIKLFYKLWVLKESYIKMHGMGLSIPLNSFSINIDMGKISVIAEPDQNECFFKLYDIASGYKTAVCSLENVFPENMELVDIFQAGISLTVI